MAEVDTSSTAPTIERLSSELINQIAAGEVVERPASVVKELVENSIDAGASVVEIHLTDGGKTEIQIIDDGIGMGPEDLPLSLERHATSKINRAADLEDIGTYGFRGEAISSIASVSQLEISSRTKSADHGWNVSVAYGTASELSPSATAKGTRFSVKNLFEQVPARQKYLRSPSTEFSHCSRVVRELALGAPGVKFYLYHQGKVVSQYVCLSRPERVAEVLRPKWELFEIEGIQDELQLEAYLSPPSLIQDRGELLLFINGRCVRNRSLMSAVKSAYLDSLGPHHEPSGVVYLDIRRDWVDVNVHPQKLEVRCLRQERIYPWLRAEVRKAVGSSFKMREVDFSPISQVSDSSQIQSTSEPYRPVQAPFFSTPTDRSELAERSQPATQVPLPLVPGRTENEPVEPNASGLNLIGQTHAAYLLCEDPEGLVVVDQHALHEKLRFEELTNQYKEGRNASQRLLVPKIVSFPENLRSVLEEHAATFEKMGFELDWYGDGDLAIKAIPEILEENKAEKVLIEAATAIRDESGEAQDCLDKAVRRVFATLACHSVVRAGQQLSREKALSLIRQAPLIQQGLTCPHGRPVMFRVPLSSLEKYFERC